MPITIKGRESTTIPEGIHSARITAVKLETRGKENFSYLDVHVDILDVETKDGKHPNIKAGFPFDLTPNTQLGKLLVAFGVPVGDISSGEPVDIEEILSVGRKVQVMTKDVVKDKGTFADIVSMKPAK